MRLLFETQLSCDWLEVKKGFTQELFKALKPPLVGLQVNRFDGCAKGDEVHIELNTLGFKQKWVSHITQDSLTDNEWSFVDEGHNLPWPLVSWKHHHRVLNLGDKSSKIIDDITFQSPYPWMDKLIAPALWMSFAIRPVRYKEFFRG